MSSKPLAWSNNEDEILNMAGWASGDFLSKGACEGLTCDLDSNGGDPAVRCSCPRVDSSGNITWSNSLSRLGQHPEAADGMRKGTHADCCSSR